MINKKKNVLLLDGHSYLYRIYYAQKKKKYSSLRIQDTLLYILKNIILKFQPKKLIIIFDTKKKNFRNNIFKEYKNNRIPMPYDLKLNIPKIYQLLVNIGIPIIYIPNIEADDIIGTLSKIAEKNGDKVIICTCDKDFAQLVNKNIYILYNINNTILKAKDIKIKYGVPPNLIIDLLSLVGDKSDNIPGVLGIGKKTAIKLLNMIGNIQKIYNNLEKIKKLSFRGYKNIIKKLQSGKEMAFLSYRLAKIQVNINLNKQYQELNFSIIPSKYQLENIKYHKIIQEIHQLILKTTK